MNESLISVSGLSSGAYFAVQFHVAFSKSIMGVGVIAGGPYYCAQNDLEIALSACMLNPELISVQELVEITYSTAATLTIDPPAHMKDDQVYIFSGLLDSVVVQGNILNWPALYSSVVHTLLLWTSCAPFALQELQRNLQSIMQNSCTLEKC